MKISKEYREILSSYQGFGEYAGRGSGVKGTSSLASLFTYGLGDQVKGTTLGLLARFPLKQRLQVGGFSSDVLPMS